MQSTDTDNNNIDNINDRQQTIHDQIGLFSANAN